MHKTNEYLRNLYQILNVAETCTEAEIKRAFRLLALQYHPDRNSSVEASRLFQETMQAYDVLSNSTLRARYDAQLRYKPNSFATIPKTYPQQAPKSEEYYKKYGTIGKFRRTNPNCVVPEKDDKPYGCFTYSFIILRLMIALPVVLIFIIMLIDALSELTAAIKNLVVILFTISVFSYGVYKYFFKEE